MTVTSTSESAAQISSALSAKESDSSEPRVLVDQGEVVEEEPEKEGISRAASEMGKKGGEAAAKARKAAEKAKAAGKVEEAEDAPEDESESTKTETTEQKDHRGNPRHDPKARVAEATREAAEARKEAAEARREAADARARLEAAERAKAPQAAHDGQPTRGPEQAPERPAKPKSNDYEVYEDYLDARDKWNRDDWTRESTERAQAHHAAAQHVERVTTTFNALKGAYHAATKDEPDFMERVSPEVMGLVPSVMLEAGQRPTASNWIADQFLRKPGQAPILSLYLSENPAEHQRIAALSSPSEITWELAKIHARLDAATAGPSSERSVSQAKPPVKPVTGSPHTADQELSDDAPLSAYVKRFGQREQKARSR